MFPRSRFFNQKLYHIRCSLKTRAFIKAGLLYVQKTLKALPYTNFLSENAFLCSCEFGSGFSGIVQFSLFDIPLGTVPSLGLGWNKLSAIHFPDFCDFISCMK